ncbi:MAG: hypothetical protein FWD67_09840 [Betaproteobacteria bacterium]|nr:hypothetical protein [Betaproteobacteria bacterium]
MKYSEFYRYLKPLGVTIRPAHEPHKKVTLSGKTSIVPHHGVEEMKKGFAGASRKTLASNKRSTKCYVTRLN